MARLIKYFGALLLIFTTWVSYSQTNYQKLSFEFYGDTFSFGFESSLAIGVTGPLTETSVKSFYTAINSANYQPLVDDLLSYKEKHELNDWVYYQLIRKTAQQISPKADNYERYTLYKWFLLAKSGYDAKLAATNKHIIFYVRNDEDITDIPFFMDNGKKYMCLNYHDYGKIDFNKDIAYPIVIDIPEARNAFSYKVTRLPDFKPDEYAEKNLAFKYRQKAYHFKVKVNPQVQTIFNNYPGVDFETYFNIPLSRETYSSLIPNLKKHMKGMSQKKGVDYLMHFTRYAFLYEDDEANFGGEKRLSPEQTLLFNASDCDDRAALFFYLVKEIYNLPMIALLYPTHITMAVQFDRPFGRSVTYGGKKFSICEPTPQSQNLRIGQTLPELHAASYEVVYHYNPDR